MSRRVLRLCLLLLVASPAACVKNPATGERQLSLVSQNQEVQMGQQAAEQVAQSIGLYPDPRLQDLVSRVGKSLAAKGERPDLPWTFHVVDDPAVNAFALPGGYIFVTRGILAHMRNEAELASVMGHEVGHVTAKHSVNMVSKATLAQLGLGLGSVLSPTVAKYGQVAAAGLQVLFLKYGRDAERQADELGFRYMTRDGYDPREMAHMFAILQRVGEAQGGGQRLPEWLSTHPNPENRLEATQKRIQESKLDLTGLKVEEQAYLALLDGLVYGNDPRKGYFEGARFLHPDLRFELTFPPGWQTANQAQAVLAGSPQQDALVALAPAGKEAPETTLQKFLSQQGVQAAQSPQGTAGLPPASSYFMAQTQDGQVVEGLTSFVSHGGATYQLLGYTVRGGLAKYDGAFRATVSSFRPLNDPAALAVQPARLKLVKLDRDLTLEQFNQQHPSNAPLEEVGLINGVKPGETLRAGTLVKQVVGGRPWQQDRPQKPQPQSAR